MTQLKNRLVNVADLEPLSVFDPSKLHTESDDAFKTYGYHQLEHLSTQYGSGDKVYVNKEASLSEWAMLKLLISQKYRDKSCRQFLTLTSTDDNLITLFPSFLKLASIAQILPINTAECERCFFCREKSKDSPSQSSGNRYLRATSQNIFGRTQIK